MSRESNLTQLWLKWVESELSQVNKFGIWFEWELSQSIKFKCWVESEFNYLDCHMSQTSQHEKKYESSTTLVLTDTLMTFNDRQLTWLSQLKPNVNPRPTGGEGLNTPSWLHSCLDNCSIFLKILSPGHQRSGHQVRSWPHLRKTFQSRHGHSGEVKDLKLSWFGVPTTCISRCSDFFYRWPKVTSISWPPHYK